MKKIDIYKKIAPHYTNHEIADILDVNERTIRRYALKTQIKFKTNKFRKTSSNEQIQKFNKHYKNKLYAKFLCKNKEGLVIGQIQCLKCNTIWSAAIQPKLKHNTGCIKCDKGNFGNKYSKQEVEEKLNQLHKNQWKLIEYSNYSQKNNIIECQFCKKQITVNLSDMINTTYMRCNYCQIFPDNEYMTNQNPNMKTVLQYMQTHSARQTERYFKIPKTKIQKYIKLAGYESISDWQSENKII